MPGESEQRAIAAFLDRETAKIDALVAKKERLIELLQEKRTSLISHAVTKGLDPDVPLKDSGVEWLGEIPAHWEVGLPLKRWVAKVKISSDGTDSRNPSICPMMVLISYLTRLCQIEKSILTRGVASFLQSSTPITLANASLFGTIFSYDGVRCHDWGSSPESIPTMSSAFGSPLSIVRSNRLSNYSEISRNGVRSRNMFKIRLSGLGPPELSLISQWAILRGYML